MSPPRKILVLVSSLGGGGAERVASLLCNAWHQAGHQVALMPTFPDDATNGYPLEAGVRLLQPTVTGPKTLSGQFRRLRELRRTLCAEQPDVLVTFLTNVNVAGLLAATGLGVRVLVCERIFPPRFPLSRSLELLRRWTYPLAERVVVQTEAIRDWFVEHHPRVRVSVIPNPLVLPLADSSPRLPIAPTVPEEACVILGVGRLDAQKGFADLLHACARLGDKGCNWHLVILGEGPERARLSSMIEALGLQGRAHLPGWAGNMSQWYQRAQLFVLSSHFEGFPNALLEAMGHGVASVAYDCPTGPSDIVDHPRNGLLVAPDAGPSGLADAMSQLLEDPPKRQAMAKQAQEVADRFSPANVLQAWAELLDHAK